jgi:hypothetical protein
VNVQRRSFMTEYDGFRVDVPEGTDGLYEIRRQTLDGKALLIANAMSTVLKTDRDVTPGTYTALLRYGRLGNPYDTDVVMSDHLCEVADHAALVNYARAHAPLKHVLINGLGLGVAIVLLSPYVTRLTLIEVSASVIRLVAPHYHARYGSQIEIVQADALTYQPPEGVHYNAVFHDIWDTISHENLVDMKLLHRKYGRLCDWQASWARVYCEREARKRQRHPEQYEHTLSTREALEAIATMF